MSSTIHPTLRIAMLVGSYAPDPEGGSERQCRLLAQALTAQGHEVEVLTFRHARFSPDASPSGIRVHRFGWWGPAAGAWRRTVAARLTRAARSRDPASAGPAERRARAMAFWLTLPATWLARLGFLLELRAFVRRNRSRFHVLHVHESGWLAGVGVAIGRRWRIPVLCKEATAPPLAPIGYDTPFRGRWERLRRGAAAWVAQTPAVARELPAYGLSPERIHLLPNGVLQPADAADPLASAGVLYVGNLTQGAAWKAFDVLFDAWVRVVKARPDARLTVVGAGDPGPWIEVLRQAGVEATVRFTGRLEDPAPAYRAAGIFLLPSRVEGMSNALLEAQSFGLACVVSDIAGNRAVVRDGINGRVVPVGDAAALAAAVVALLDNPALRDAWGRRGRATMAAEYGMDKVTGTLISLYRSLAAPVIA